MPELHKILDDAWARLRDGAEVRGAGFRILQAASVGPKGEPRVRTVVMRRADKAARTVSFHTDLRSPKSAELRANPAVSLIAYQHETGQQIRLEGLAQLHQADALAREAWTSARDQSLICYRARHAPGAALTTPDEADVTDDMREPSAPDLGFENFCAVIVHVHRLDWLDLAETGHRRAAFDWDGNEWRGAWIAP